VNMNWSDEYHQELMERMRLRYLQSQAMPCEAMREGFLQYMAAYDEAEIARKSQNL